MTFKIGGSISDEKKEEILKKVEESDIDLDGYNYLFYNGIVLDGHYSLEDLKFLVKIMETL